MQFTQHHDNADENIDKCPSSRPIIVHLKDDCIKLSVWRDISPCHWSICFELSSKVNQTRLYGIVYSMPICGSYQFI